jgi:putative aldouronate transport system permease protein
MGGAIKQTKSDIIFDVINIIILTIILLIVLYPLIFVLSASFSDPMAVMKGEVKILPKSPTLRAYKSVFANEDIMSGYRNTIMYTVVGTAVNLIMTIAGAYPLSRKDFYGRKALTLFFTFTMFFSGGLIPSYLVNTSLGLYNNFWVMILPGAVSVWNMFIMRAFFQNSIPNELQEAAVIDGCTNIGILLKIVLPLSAPIIAVMVMYYGVGHWNAYFTALIYFRDRSKFPLQLILREILIKNDMNEMLGEETMVSQELLAETIKYAVIVVASMPVLLMYPFLQKYFVKGVMVGAIKG